MARRRRVREQPFGFDAFVDLVTNLVGVVLRLILVVMMGAHLHGAYQPTFADNGATESQPPGDDLEAAALHTEIAGCQSEVAQLQNRLADTLRAMNVTQQHVQKLGDDRARLAQHKARSADAIGEGAASVAVTAQAVAKAQNDRRSLKERIAELDRAMQEVEKQPPDKRALRFHLPISRPVSAGELLFELRENRVTFVDLQAFLDLIKQATPQKVELLRKKWEVTDVTEPVGAFRVRYVIARERAGGLDRAFADLPPTEERGFAYGLDTWDLVPLVAVRGETLAEALADGSHFRRVVDSADADQVVLTFFVYADSFEMYRQLRDQLYDRGFMVVWPALTLDRPISGSRGGTLSRGQ